MNRSQKAKTWLIPKSMMKMKMRQDTERNARRRVDMVDSLLTRLK